MQQYKICLQFYFKLCVSFFPYLISAFFILIWLIFSPLYYFPLLFWKLHILFYVYI